MRQDVGVIPLARLGGLALASAAASTLLSGCGSPGPGEAAKAYLSAWSRGDLSAASLKTSDPTSSMQTLTRLRADLHIDRVATHLGKVSSQSGSTSAEYTADVAVHGVGTWHYTATLQLEKAGGHWRGDRGANDNPPPYGPGKRRLLDPTPPTRGPRVGGPRQPDFTPTAGGDGRLRKEGPRR